MHLSHELRPSTEEAFPLCKLQLLLEPHPGPSEDSGRDWKTADRPRSGRSRVTTPGQDRRIVISHLRDRFMPATAIVRITLGQHNPRISCHTARLTRDFLQTNGIQVMPLTAKSPGLNATEHGWDILERRVRSRPHQPQNLKELRQAFFEEWDRIPQQEFDNLIGSMRKRWPYMLLIKLVTLWLHPDLTRSHPVC